MARLDNLRPKRETGASRPRKLVTLKVHPSPRKPASDRTLRSSVKKESVPVTQQATPVSVSSEVGRKDPQIPAAKPPRRRTKAQVKAAKAASTSTSTSGSTSSPSTSSRPAQVQASEPSSSTPSSTPTTNPSTPPAPAPVSAQQQTSVATHGIFHMSGRVVSTWAESSMANVEPVFNPIFGSFTNPYASLTSEQLDGAIARWRQKMLAEDSRVCDMETGLMFDSEGEMFQWKIDRARRARTGA